jgi:hypothetical protein
VAVDSLHHAFALGVVGSGGVWLTPSCWQVEAHKVEVNVHGGHGYGLQPVAGPVFDGEKVPEALLVNAWWPRATGTRGWG